MWKYRSEEIKDEDRQLCSILHDGAEAAKDDVDGNAWFESTSWTSLETGRSLMKSMNRLEYVQFTTNLQ